MSLRLRCLPLFLLLLSSCTSTQKIPVYTGSLFGDSVRVYPLPFPVNTPANEYAPTVSADGEVMYFGRNTGSGSMIYRTEVDSGYAPIISRAVTRFTAADLVFSFAAPGRAPNEFITVGCHLEVGLGSCDLYELILNDDHELQRFSNISRVNSREWESFPTISGSGEELWFATIQRSRAISMTEIRNNVILDGENSNLMVSQIQPDGWGSATWAGGDSINTRWDETSPAFGFGDSVLFFVSDRPGGVGGMDIYITFRLENGEWGSPMNMGRPINSEANEIGVYVLPGDNFLLISSDREIEGAQGGSDIYVVDLQFGGPRAKTHP